MRAWVMCCRLNASNQTEDAQKGPLRGGRVVLTSDSATIRRSQREASLPDRLWPVCMSLPHSAWCILPNVSGCIIPYS